VKTKRWHFAEQASTDYVDRLRQEGIQPTLAQVFYARGYDQPEAALDFLGAYQQVVDPFVMAGMDRAVERICRAIESEEPIAIYGDFDCDGVTSTVLLTEVLRRLGANVRPYIPDRVDEGYGLNSLALHWLKEKGCGLVITVDCGIRSVQEVIDGTGYGLDMILSDHHSIGPELPPALAVINPKQANCPYPEKMLAGVGLAFKIAQGVHTEAVRRGYAGADEWSPDEWLDLVAIGTVADIAPLRGENRSLVLRGLEQLNRPKRIGLRALYGAAGVRPGAVTAITIGFIIGPRINAAGRLRSAYLAAKLLSAQNEQEAGSLALELNTINQERQHKTREMQSWAEESIPGELGEVPLLFASDDRFEQGVVGLVASRLTEEHYRPSAVVQIGEEESHGSCRSIPEFHITHALEECRDLLQRFGGHAAAAGFTVLNENIEPLKKRLIEVAGKELAGRELFPSLSVDAELPLHLCSLELADSLARLEPCGEANPLPLFVTRGVTIVGRRQIGADGKHLKLEVTDGGDPVEAIAFRMGEDSDTLPLYVDVAYHLEANEWNGRRRLQLNVQDIRPAAGQE
jgi:single-stranded-DNA-specific exonuclease